MKRIVISDTHIGSKYYNGEELITFLKEAEYDQLILAGDIIDFIRIPMFGTRAAEIAQAIDYTKDIIYLVGNHDTPLTGLIGRELYGIKFMANYEFEEAGRTFRIEHGDAYDDHSFIHNDIIMGFISISQNCIEHWFEVNLSDLYTDYKIKRRKLRRIWDILKSNSDVDVFIMGHSHTPEAIVWIHSNQVIKTYVNSGDWVSHTTYVEIDDGIVRLREHGNTGN
jgi:UDP-2,3-diacylglucosamine pyrophosphatase LpxH